MSIMDEVIKDQNKRALEMAAEGVPLVHTKVQPFARNSNDCKIKKRHLNHLQLFFVNGKTKTYFAHMNEYQGSDRNEYSRYLNELPERSAEEVLKNKI